MDTELNRTMLDIKVGNRAEVLPDNVIQRRFFLPNSAETKVQATIGGSTRSIRIEVGRATNNLVLVRGIEERLDTNGKSRELYGSRAHEENRTAELLVGASNDPDPKEGLKIALDRLISVINDEDEGAIDEAERNKALADLSGKLGITL